MTTLNQLEYKKIILEIAKSDPALIIATMNHGTQSPKRPKLVDNTWKGFHWYDDALDAIKNNRMMVAGRIIYSHEDVSDSDAMRIVREIKDHDTEPTLPSYAEFKLVGGSYQVIAFKETIIAGGDTKYGAALKAWDWHRDQLKKNKLIPPCEAQSVWLGNKYGERY